MLIKRWFGDEASGWYQESRNIHATFNEQLRFYRHGVIPESTSNEDVTFLMDGLCLPPEELRQLALGC